MQAMVVLLLELSVEATQSSRTSKLEFSKGVHKLSLWLQSMAVKDAVSQRAYSIMCGILKDHGESVLFDASEHLTEKAMQQGNADPFATNNMIDGRFGDIVGHVEVPYVACNTSPSQSALGLWPHDWPDNNYFFDIHHNDHHLESLSDTVAAQSNLDGNQDQVPSGYEDRFMADFEDTIDDTWDLTGFVF
jgi:hypothetical protein